MTDVPEFETFTELMTLEPHGPDVYVGLSPEYPWGRVYGGQVVAQGLKAACLTVDGGYRPHSVHAYFIRGGTWHEPIRYEVDRIRNGRSFLTRRVVARQSNGAILNLACSFHLRERQADVQTVAQPPGVPDPETLPADDWGIMERRPVPAEHLDGRVGVWLRVKGVGDEAFADTLAIAYASDDLPTDAAAGAHPDLAAGEPWEGIMTASLDHAIWFHRDAPAEEWQLHIMEGQGLTGARGLSFGHIVDRRGLHVASLAQEILLRTPRSFHE